MKIVLINKSDSTGGAAIVSYRLMEALRKEGVDARMLVVEKRQESDDVMLAASPLAMKIAFLAERLHIFCVNGFDRKNLFKVDIASDGVNLSKHPWVEQADAIILNWVNQGMLSLKGIKQLCCLGKPVIWTMHDMWCFTGICHHSGTCVNYRTYCRNCKFLGKKAHDHDISNKVFKKKRSLYPGSGIHFVAVSNWLRNQAVTSALFRESQVSVIPNPFPLEDDKDKYSEKKRENKRVVLFGAARLDDPIKGFPILIATTSWLRKNYPEEAERVELILFGDIRDSSLLEKIEVTYRYLGRIEGHENLRRIYEEGDVILSTSLYETLPGTLVEGQAYGCIPVSFGRGGQRDIVEHLSTGYIANFNEEDGMSEKTLMKNASAIGEGLLWAFQQDDKIYDRMRASVESKFSYSVVAKSYLDIVAQM